MAVLGEPSKAGRPAIEVVPQGTEWAAVEDDDDEEDTGPAQRRHASQVFLRRESRLSDNIEALKQDRSLGDTDVEVVVQNSEWAAAVEDSDEEGAGQPAQRVRTESFSRREQRLSANYVALQKGVMMGDADVEVKTENKEWAGLPKGVDSDDEYEEAQDKNKLLWTEQQRRATHDSEVRRRREVRISLSAKALQEQKPLADRDVEDGRQATNTLRAQESFNRREARLSVSKQVLGKDAAGPRRWVTQRLGQLCCCSN
mmetsp:Transcript_81711/g.210382  ORF Transcript_81711/g.210382 Transcript_81711/m.210382 type:complete len:257 (+) Transcript_81711:129-899(+)